LDLLLVARFFFKAVVLLVLEIAFFSTLMVEILLGFEKCSLITVDCFAIIIAFSAVSGFYKKIKNKIKLQFIHIDHIFIRYSHIVFIY